MEFKKVTLLLKALGHPLRLRILDFLLAEATPQRVTEIVAASEGTPQAVVSQQLKVLRDSGVLLAQRRGNCVYYAVQDRAIEPLFQAVRSCLTETSSPQ